MLPEIGLFSLCLAFALSTLGSMGIGFMHKIYPDKAYQAIVATAWLIIGLCTASFSILVYSYSICDFSLSTVVFNSCQEQSVFYRVAAVWSNHEGSMMLWLFLLQMTLVLLVRQHTPELAFKFWTIFIQISLIGLFLGFILIDCQPFERFFPPPVRGLGLNPALHDLSLGFHPPTLYTALVGYSGLFSLTVAGALTQSLTTLQWGAQVRSWALHLWALQTIGITLGSWWAYYELGWGGWWAWDPVENVSLLPWLINLGTLHCLKPYFHRTVSPRLLLVMGTGPFLSSVFGTLLVRSGAISSLHAFVRDTSRGILLSALCCGLIAGVVILYRTKLKNQYSVQKFQWNNPLFIQLLFLAGCILALGFSFVVLLAAPLLQRPLSLHGAYFQYAFLPFFLGLAIFMPYGYALSLYGKIPFHLKQQFLRMGCLSLAILAFFLSPIAPFPHLHSLDKALGFGTAFWVITTTAILTWERYCSAIKNFKRPGNGGLLSHAGIGVFLLGTTAHTFCSLSETVVLRIGETVTVEDFTVTLKDIVQKKNSLYETEQALLKVQYKHKIFDLAPENHFFLTQQRSHSRTAIQHFGTSDLYIAMGQHDQNPKEYFFSIYKNTGILFVWAGALLMALGAFVQGGLRRFFTRTRKE